MYMYMYQYAISTTLSRLILIQRNSELTKSTSEHDAVNTGQQRTKVSEISETDIYIRDNLFSYSGFVQNELRLVRM